MKVNNKTITEVYRLNQMVDALIEDRGEYL